MPLLFESLSHQIYLSAPLFILILLGYCLTRLGKWPASISEGMNRFVFNVALPCMLFRVMSTFSQSPPVDARLLLAFSAVACWCLSWDDCWQQGCLIWMA